jgi:hypothetical protein
MCGGANGKRDRHLAISLHTQANKHTERALIYVHATSYFASYVGAFDAKPGVMIHSVQRVEHQVKGNE